MLPLVVASVAICAAGSGDEHLTVVPALVEIAPERRYEDLSIHNGSAVAQHVRTGVYAWSQGADGTMYLQPTDDVSAFPCALTVLPGEWRRVRLSVVRRGDGRERAYRVVLDVSAAGDAGGVRVLVPAFVVPPADDSPSAPPPGPERAWLLTAERAAMIDEHGSR